MAIYTFEIWVPHSAHRQSRRYFAQLDNVKQAMFAKAEKEFSAYAEYFGLEPTQMSHDLTWVNGSRLQQNVYRLEHYLGTVRKTLLREINYQIQTIELEDA
jgi:hypothetical protein